MADSIHAGPAITPVEGSDVPRPPTEEERERYYYGVEGTLLARTSTDELPAVCGHPPNRAFATIGQHPILSAWSPTLAQSIQAALIEINWIRIYPIRIGWEHRNGLVDDHVILLVDVLPGTATWESASVAASDCRRLLEQQGLHDVEVELREVTPRPHGGVDALRQVMDPAHWRLRASPSAADYLKPAETLNEFLSPSLPDLLGFEISPRDAPNKLWRGTMGPIIELAGRPSELYGLACRHVVHSLAPSTSFPLQDYHRPYTAENVRPADRHLVISPGRTKWANVEEALRKSAKDETTVRLDLETQQRKNICEPAQYDFSATDEADLASTRQCLEYYEKLLNFLDAAEMEPSVIGHVAFMPPLGLSQAGFLRDWALVRFDKANMDKLPSNKVLLPHKRSSFVDNDSYDRKENTIMLSRTISGKKPSERKTIPVAKRGVGTGFTFGTTNEIKALVRSPVVDGPTVVCWEWIVVADTGRQHSKIFSAPGDSGSCVFDDDGRVVGLLTGGYGTVKVRTPARRRQPMSDADTASTLEDPGPDNYVGIVAATPSLWSTIYDANARPDLTFVTPIDYLFDDIRQVTGFEPRLAGQPA